MAAVFSEIEIGGRVVDNRVVHASSDNRRAPWGRPSQLARKFYIERSQGKSLTISEPVGVGYSAGTSLFAPLIASSEQITAWKAIVDLIHQLDGRFYIKLFHRGRITTKGVLLRNQVYYQAIKPKFHIGKINEEVKAFRDSAVCSLVYILKDLKNQDISHIILK